MKYYKIYEEVNAKPFEISKDEARRTLEGYWKPEALDDIFDNEKSFRLFNKFSTVWTQTEEGLEPAPNFYGVCE